MTYLLGQEQKLKEDSAKEVEAETDYLAVIMVQIGDKPLSPQNVLEVRNYCLNEYKMLLVDRANKMQLKFDKVEYKHCSKPFKGIVNN